MYNLEVKVFLKGGDDFYGCTALTEIILPDRLEEIDERAFQNCEGLKEIAIPEKVTTAVSEYLFYGCNSLEKACVKGENATIGEDAFAWCRNLEKNF